MSEKIKEIRCYDFRKENREYAPHLAEENSRVVEGYAIVFNQQSRKLYDKASKKVLRFADTSTLSPPSTGV